MRKFCSCRFQVGVFDLCETEPRRGFQYLRPRCPLWSTKTQSYLSFSGLRCPCQRKWVRSVEFVRTGPKLATQRSPILFGTWRKSMYPLDDVDDAAEGTR